MADVDPAVAKLVTVHIDKETMLGSPAPSLHVSLRPGKPPAQNTKIHSMSIDRNMIDTSKLTDNDILRALEGYGLSSAMPRYLPRASLNDILTNTDEIHSSVDCAPRAYGGPTVWPFTIGDLHCSFTADGTRFYFRFETEDVSIAFGAFRRIIIAAAHVFAARIKPPVESTTVRIWHVPDTMRAQWDTLRDVKKRNLSTIYLDDDKKTRLTMGLESFLKMEDEYGLYCIPWKRVHLFTGPPGTGKSSMVIALASLHNYGIARFSIHPSMTPGSLERLIQSLPARTFLLIEDIDALFTRKNDGTAANNIDFSTVLQAFDGIGTKPGLIAFLTSNHLERLDEALIRPGRVDVHIQFQQPERKQIEEALKMLGKRYVAEHEKFLTTVCPDGASKISIASLQRYLFDCIQLGRESLFSHISEIVK